MGIDDATLSVICAVIVCLSFGTSDFLGALKSRTMRGFTVLMVSQLAGLVLIAVATLIFADGAPSLVHVGWALVAGVVGLVGIAAFWGGMAIGPINIVAPVAAAAAVVPVGVGLASGERPTAIQFIGTVLVIAGVVAVARTTVAGGQRARPLGIWLGIVTAICFGSVVVLLEQAKEMDLLWTVFFARVGAVVSIAAAAAYLRGPFEFERPDMPMLVTIGFLDLVANFCMAASAATGLVSVAGPIISLHTLVTILLARYVLGDRMRVTQRLGAGAALLGGAIIAWPS